MGHPVPGTTPQLGTPKSPWIQKPNWPDWKNTPITLWLFWHLPTEVMESKVRFTQPLLNKMFLDLPLLWKPWPCLKIRFWFHGNLSLYSVCSRNSGRIPTGEARWLLKAFEISQELHFIILSSRLFAPRILEEFWREKPVAFRNIFNSSRTVYRE